MKLVKHPIRAIREPFGTAGLIVAIVALVAALGGGAYAASQGALSGKQKKEVEKIAKKYAGKNGKNGKNGSNGAPGAKGDTGATGAKGTDGSNGSPGAPGAKGEGVTIKAYTGEECATASEEGTEFSNASGKSYACNGENGQTGFTTSLPSGKSEQGTWAVGPFPGAAAAVQAFVPVSFSIPLAAPLANHTSVHYMPEEAAATTECPGTSEAPAAAPGNLCIFSTVENGATFKPPFDPETTFEQAGRSGTLLHFEMATATSNARGVWVVTAP